MTDCFLLCVSVFTETAAEGAVSRLSASALVSEAFRVGTERRSSVFLLKYTFLVLWSISVILVLSILNRKFQRCFTRTFFLRLSVDLYLYDHSEDFCFLVSPLARLG